MQIYLQDPVRNLTALRLYDPATYRVYTTILFLKWYYTPGLIMTGIVGNIICCLTLRNKAFQTISAVPYIVGLAIFDTVFLASLFAIWLSHFGVDLYNSENWCEVLTYSTYICGWLPVWLTLCLSVDRALTVHSDPRRTQRLCTPLKAKMAVVAFVAVAVAVFLNVSLLYGLIETHVGNFCIILPQFARVLSVLSKMDIAINFILPYSVMFVLIILTTARSYKINTWRQTVIQTPDGQASLDSCIRLSKIQREICRPSCLLCAALLTLNCPSHILRLIATVSGSLTETAFLSQQLCIFLMFTRAGLTFPILLSSSGSFRKALWAPFSQFFAKRSVGNVHQTLVEFSLSAFGQGTSTVSKV